jgi:hypothetical protein
MKIKCINADGGTLTINKIYNVVSESPKYYYIHDDSCVYKHKDDNLAGYFKHRFEIVNDVNVGDVVDFKISGQVLKLYGLNVRIEADDGMTFELPIRFVETNHGPNIKVGDTGLTITKRKVNVIAIDGNYAFIKYEDNETYNCCPISSLTKV